MTLRSIMLIPIDFNIDVNIISEKLVSTLKNNNINSLIFQDLKNNLVQDYLVKNDLDTLFMELFIKKENLLNKAETIIINGLDIVNFYSMELNLSIALSLEASIIFVTSSNIKIEDTFNKIKIIINSYLSHYKVNILGFVTYSQSKLLSGELDNDKNNNLQINLPFLGSENEIKLEKFKHFFYEKIDEQYITPTKFKYKLIEKAISLKKTIVLPEGTEPRTIMAANICSQKKIAKCILLGEKYKIMKICNDLHIFLDEEIEIIEPNNIIEKYVDKLYEIRRLKGLTLDESRNQLKDNIVLGTMMLYLNEVDGLVSGAEHTTADTIRPALQIIKTSAEIKLVSSIFFMCLPNDVLVYGDCAINQNPSVEDLVNIAIQSSYTASAFGLNPKVAMLSYSTGTSGSGLSVDKVRQATEFIKKEYPSIQIEGPIQYDAAISIDIAKTKAPQSQVAGKANVFIMPSLDVGNIVYKAVQRSANITCIGPILQGLKRPVNDLSRGCSIDDIVFTIASTVVQTTNKI